MFNSIFQVADQPVIFEFLIALGTALFLGFLTSFLYMKVQKDKVLSENFILALVIPVSYTHLDVYKRQDTVRIESAFLPALAAFKYSAAVSISTHSTPILDHFATGDRPFKSAASSP